MQHRPEIDGLRAFAVLPVMFFHAGFSWVSGGFIGVDVFFVISGFLITSIVQREVTEQRFTLVGFYERRARRIFPALFTTILICFPFAWWLMDATQLKAFGKSVIAVSVFLANFYFAGAANYFEPAGELMPLLHTWSLSVEEQFYVFFPLLLLALSFLGITRTRNIVVILSLLALGAFALTIFMAKINPTLNFYWPVSRAWELLAGAIAAFVYTRPADKTKLQECIAALGFVMLIGGVLFLRAEMEYRFAYSIFPVIGTVLVLVAADSRTLIGRFLMWRPFVVVGLISYSAYLLHQPIFVFARYYLGIDPSLPIACALLIATLAGAYLSWRLVEEPIRNKKGRFYLSRTMLFAVSACFIGLFGMAGYAIIKFDGFATRMSPTLEQAMVARKSVKRFPGQCQYSPALNQFNVPSQLPDHCHGHEPTNLGDAATDAPYAMIIGDSYGGATADSFMQVLAEEGWRSAKITVAGCASLPGFDLMGGQLQCAKAFDRIKGIVSQQKPDLLIVVNRYNFLFNDQPFDNGEGGSGTLGPFGTISHDRLGPDHDLQERAAAIVSSGVKVLSDFVPNIAIVYPIPEAGWYVPHLFERQKARDIYQGVISISSDLYWQRNQAAVAALDSARSDKVIKLDPYPLFCNRHDFPGRCLHARGDQLFYGDTNHLTKTGADMLAETLRPVLQDLH